jgi:thiol:disulfide interchange protein DsbC
VSKLSAPLLAGLVSLLAAGTALATRVDARAATPGPGRDSLAAAEAHIRAAFAKSFPGVRITGVAATKWRGVYEAVTPEGIIYADATGQFAMNGKMVDVASKANITDERLADLQRIDFGSLPFERAIKRVKGDGSRKLAVFADPDCPYCRQLEKELLAVDNVTIYTFLFPLDELHPDASKHASRIWCAKDPSATWQAWLVDQVEPPEASCDGDPSKELAALGNKLEIVGTPTLFLANGRRIPGVVPLEDLERELGKARAN